YAPFPYGFLILMFFVPCFAFLIVSSVVYGFVTSLHYTVQVVDLFHLVACCLNETFLYFHFSVDVSVLDYQNVRECFVSAFPPVDCWCWCFLPFSDCVQKNEWQFD